MPFMIAPMPCSRMPKWRTRPCSGSAFHSSTERSSGRNDGAPLMVVLLEPARSADPPHSSGMSGAIALITWPDAARVATPLASAGKVGSASSSPSGSSRPFIRNSSAACSAWSAAQASYCRSHSAPHALPRSSSDRVCSRTSSGTSKVRAGSKPSTSLVAATSSSPSAEPCAASVFWALGAGQAMIVRSTIMRRLVGDRVGGLDRLVERRARPRRSRRPWCGRRRWSSRRSGRASRRPRSAWPRPR